MAARKKTSTPPTGTTVPGSTTATPEEQFAQQQGDMPVATVKSEKTTGVPEDYVGPARIFGGVSKPMRATQLTSTATGQPVMQYNPATGKMEPVGLYDIYKQAGAILATEMDDVERLDTLKKLKSRGIGYSKNEQPGNGFTPADRSAMAELLLQSNILLRPWKETLDYIMATTPPAPTGTGTAKKYQVTPDSEISAVIQASAQNLLGRMLSKQEVDTIGDVIQQTQIRYQKGVAGPQGSLQEMPGVETMAIQQLKKKYGEESSQVKMVRFADILNRAVSSRGQ